MKKTKIILDVNDLTQRQKDLIEFLEDGQHRTIYEVVAFVDGYEFSNNPKAHDPCPAVCTDIHTINNSNYEKIIVIDNFTYYIATEQEAKDYLNKLQDSLIPRLVRYWNIKKKTENDGQAQFDFRDEQAIIDYVSRYL